MGDCISKNSPPKVIRITISELFTILKTRSPAEKEIIYKMKPVDCITSQENFDKIRGYPGLLSIKNILVLFSADPEGVIMEFTEAQASWFN